MGDEQETPSVKGLQESFWFHREDDEDFVDNLSIRKGLDKNEQKKDYSEFLAVSTRLSVQSFVPQRSVNLNNKVNAQFIANELVPEAEEPPTFLESLYNHKIAILTLAFAFLCILFISTFTIPVSELNNSGTNCVVVNSTIKEIECSNGNTGICLELDVFANLGDGEISFDILQGFDNENIKIESENLNCAVSNCVNDPFAAIDLNNLPEICTAQIEDQNLTIEDLTDEQLLQCNALSTSFSCVFLQPTDSSFKTAYFQDVDLSQNSALSLPKQPEPQVVILSTLIMGLALLVLIVASVTETYFPYSLPFGKQKKVVEGEEETDQNISPTTNENKDPNERVEVVAAE